LLSIATVLVARYSFPQPRDLEPERSAQTRGFSREYWWYMVGAGCIAAGFADFALIGYHFEKTATMPSNLIPVYYAIAMGVGAIGALVLGRLFDRQGIRTVIGAFLLSAFFAPFVFLGSARLALLGMVLWGLGMAAQESLLLSLVAGIVAVSERGTAFGLFDTGFGVAWFLGSWLMGYLYSVSIHGLVFFSVAIQLLALPIFLKTPRAR
jgi:predicted MFS family arabinose efflux permease